MVFYYYFRNNERNAMSLPVSIPESVSLAVHAMARLASDGSEAVKLNDLLIKPGSVAHLSKVMQKLTKVGMVKSRRGRGGGFTLGVNASDIRLMDIWIALEGTFETSLCPYLGSGCTIPVCLFGTIGKDASQLIRDYFTNTTVEDIGKLLKKGQNRIVK
ncbi:Rrf2 family transcriptional regulator [Candidatus Fermentibacteria bacterium]|nr:MAG: Rrf2 family transcriptional regulator [Candidatus Fermentibacteria bacterium]